MAQNTPQFGRTTRGIADDAGLEGGLAQADAGAGSAAVRVLHDTFSLMPAVDDAAEHEAVCLGTTPLRERRLARSLATKQLDRTNSDRTNGDRANGTVLQPRPEGPRIQCAAENSARNSIVAGTRRVSADKKPRSSRRHDEGANEEAIVNQLQKEVWSKDQEILQLRALYQEQAQQFHSFRTESSAEVEALKRRMAEFEQLLQTGSSPAAAAGGFCWSPVLLAADASWKDLVAKSSDSPTEESTSASSSTVAIAKPHGLRPPALLAENLTTTPPEGGVPSQPPTPPSAVANGCVVARIPSISGIATNGGQLLSTPTALASSSGSGRRRIQSSDPPLLRLRRAALQQQQQQQCIPGAEQPQGSLHSPRCSQQVAWPAVLSPRNSLKRSFCSPGLSVAAAAERPQSQQAAQHAQKPLPLVPVLLPGTTSGAPSPRLSSARSALPTLQARSSSPEASTCTKLQGQRSSHGSLVAAGGPPPRRAQATWQPGPPGAAAARPPPGQSGGMRQAPLAAGWGLPGRSKISGGRSTGSLTCASTASAVG